MTKKQALKLTVAIFFLGFCCFIPKTKASTTVVENFDTYSVGNIDSKSSAWIYNSGYHLKATTTQKYSSPNGLIQYFSYHNGGTLYNPAGIGNLKYFSFKFKFNDGSDQYVELIGQNSTTYSPAVITDDLWTLQIRRGNWCHFNGFNFSSAISDTNWHDVIIEYNGSQYRACVDTICSSYYSGEHPGAWDSIGFNDNNFNHEYNLTFDNLISSSSSTPSIDMSIYFTVQFAPSLICIIGEICRLVLNDDWGAEQWVINLYPYSNASPFNTPLSSTIMTWNEALLTIPATTTPSKIEYWVDSFPQNMSIVEYQKLTVYWVVSLPLFQSTSTLQIICDNIATSSGSVWDDIRFGLECGSRKILYWAFYPDKNIINNIQQTFNNLKTRFPLSSYFDLTDIIYGAIATSSQSQSFDIPMITATGTFYMLPVLNASSVSNAIGSTNSTLFRNTIIYILWAFVALFIIYRLTKRE